MDSRFRAAVEQARKSGDLYFAGLLSKERITASLSESRVWFQGWIYSGTITVWVFLSQCLAADHSCREAVARLTAWRVKNGQSACSADTSAYCTARDQLPEKTCRDLALSVGHELHQQAPESWLWKTRRVILGDGSTFTMADTEANQKEYPQQSGQKAGCGFPIMRALVLFSLAVGSVIEAAISPYSGKLTGENSLLRTLHSTLKEGDVLVLDRYFSGWFDIALLQQRGVDVVVRKHQLRATDFRKGQRLGKDDQLVAAVKSGLCPHQISFKGTMQTLNQFLPMLPDAVSLDHWYDSLLEAIATQTVADRPDRIEPRCRKRRPKKFKNLREHRSAYKIRLRSRS